jgi:hypothetical protein
MMYHIPGRSAFKADLATLIDIAGRPVHFFEQFRDHAHGFAMR